MQDVLAAILAFLAPYLESFKTCFAIWPFSVVTGVALIGAMSPALMFLCAIFSRLEGNSSLQPIALCDSLNSVKGPGPIECFRIVKRPLLWLFCLLFAPLQRSY